MLIQKSFQIGNVSLNYVEGPSAGPPLLFLHGVTQRWQEFIQIIPALTETFHVYAVDFRGHGKSSRVEHGYRGEGFSQDILAFLDQIIGKPAIVFGHSLGGMVSLYLSAYYPDRFIAQILGDSIIFGAEFAGTVLPSMFGQVYGLISSDQSYERLRVALPEMCLESPIFGKAPFKAFPGCDETYTSAWARSLSQMDPEVLGMMLNGSGLEGWEPEDLISRIQCPTLLIQADPKMGGLMTDLDVARIKEAQPQVQVVRMTGIGHSLHMYDPAPVLRALTNFLVTLDL